jgi:hypothetical protein
MTTEATDNELMTDRELCVRLRISLPTLRKYVELGEDNINSIPHCVVCGQRRWNRVAVEAFITGNQTTTA